MRLDLFYRRAGIFVVVADDRWKLVAPLLSGDAGIEHLQDTARTLTADTLPDCVALLHLTKKCTRSLSSLPAYLRVLGQLRTPATAPASLRNELHKEITSVIKDAVAECPLGLWSTTLPRELDALVTYVNMNVVEEHFRATFTHTMLGDHFSPIPATQTLQRFVVLQRDGTLPLRWDNVVQSLCTSLFCRVRQQDELEKMSLESLLAIIAPVLTLLLDYFELYERDDDEGANNVESSTPCSNDAVATASALSRAFVRALSDACDRATEDTSEASRLSISSPSANRILQLETSTLSRVLDEFSPFYDEEQYELEHCGPVLSALAPLVRPLKSWLEQIAAPLPDAASWEHPTCGSPVFRNQPRYNARWCECDACRTLRTFLRSASMETCTIREPEQVRRHAEELLSELRNPYLRCETIGEGSTHALKVTKTAHMRPLFEARITRLRALLAKVDKVLDTFVEETGDLAQAAAVAAPAADAPAADADAPAAVTTADAVASAAPAPSKRSRDVGDDDAGTAAIDSDDAPPGPPPASKSLKTE